MPRKPIIKSKGAADTQTRILDTATELFAIKGFKSVSLREIARAVGIKIPSLYYYYRDKDALIEAVLLRFGKAYQDCYQWLSEKNAHVETLEDVVNNLFDKDFFSQLGPLVQLGMSMTLKEKSHHELAYRLALQHFYEDGIRNIQMGFDKLIEKGVIPLSDTKTMATIFMFCIMGGNDLHIHDVAGKTLPIDISVVQEGLKDLLIASLMSGTIKVKTES